MDVARHPTLHNALFSVCVLKGIRQWIFLFHYYYFSRKTQSRSLALVCSSQIQTHQDRLTYRHSIIINIITIIVVIIAIMMNYHKFKGTSIKKSKTPFFYRNKNIRKEKKVQEEASVREEKTRQRVYLFEHDRWEKPIIYVKNQMRNLSSFHGWAVTEFKFLAFSHPTRLKKIFSLCVEFITGAKALHLEINNKKGI